MKCRIKGCDKEVRVKIYKLCNGHALRLYRGKTLDGKLQERKPKGYYYSLVQNGGSK